MSESLKSRADKLLVAAVTNLNETGKEKRGGYRPGAGRPRKKERCPCGENTLQRAIDRCFECCKKHGLAPKA